MFDWWIHYWLKIKTFCFIWFKNRYIANHLLAYYQLTCLCRKSLSWLYSFVRVAMVWSCLLFSFSSENKKTNSRCFLLYPVHEEHCFHKTGLIGWRPITWWGHLPFLCLMWAPTEPIIFEFLNFSIDTFGLSAFL